MNTSNKTTTTKHRLLLAAALLVALLVGFAAARLMPVADSAKADSKTQSSEAAHADEDGHEQGDADHGAEDAGREESGAEQGIEEEGHEEGEGEAPEGLVALTAEQIKGSGIDVVAVRRGSGGEASRLSGRVEPAVGARASVAASINGRVEQVLVASGTRVRANQALAMLVSGEAATMRANADAARAEAEAARLVYRRDQSLVTQGVVARQELEASRARSLAADAAARAAGAQASAVGNPDSRGRVTITSPVPGVVSEVKITPGGFVSSGDIVAEVSDPSRTELVFTAPPALASQIEPGARIEVTGPSGNFAAIVIGAAADIHSQGGMAIIRARPLTDKLPAAGSAVAGVVVSNEKDSALTVPADAVQTVEGRSVVFVAVAKGFRATPVLAGQRAGGSIEILNGLTGNERIAGSNAFLLKAELAKGQAEHGH